MRHHPCCLKWLRSLFEKLEMPRPAAPGEGFVPKVRLDVLGRFRGRLAYAQLECGSSHSSCEFVVIAADSGTTLASGSCAGKCAS